MNLKLKRIKFIRLSALFLLLASACTTSPSVAGSPTPAPVSPTLPASPTSTPPSATPDPTETPLPTASATPVIEVCFPLAGHSAADLPVILSQGFIPPAPGKDDGHHGIDLVSYVNNRMTTGMPVLASLPGAVAAVIRDRPPYGEAVLVETTYEQIPADFIERNEISPGESLYLLYAHLQNLPDLQTGQAIQCGQPLGETGLTGFTGGPHLHFETRSGPPGITFESMAFYSTSASEQETQNYLAWRTSDLFRMLDPLPLIQPTLPPGN